MVRDGILLHSSPSISSYFIFNYDTLSLLSDSLTRGEITLPIKYALTINHYIKENHSIYFFYHVRTRDQNHFRVFFHDFFSFLGRRSFELFPSYEE